MTAPLCCRSCYGYNEAGQVERRGIEPLPELPQDDPFWQMMQGIWAAQKARGHVPRSKEEIDAEINAMREESQEETR